MKRLIIAAILSSALLCSCTASNKSGEKKQSSTGNAIENHTASGAVAVSGEVIIHLDTPMTAMNQESGGQEKNVQMNKVHTVTDITGRKRKLRLGDVDTDKKEVLVQQPDSFAEYAQVADGHYYYLRKERENRYTHYCDLGNRIGSFGMDEGYYFQGCCKYGDRFYVVLYRCDEYKTGTTILDEYSVLTVADFSKGDLRTLRKIENIRDYEMYFYSDKIKLYYSPNNTYDDWEEDGKEDENTEKEKTYEYDIMGNEEPVYDEEYKNYIIDGNRYYTKAGKEVYVIRQDMERQKQEEIFCYRLQGKNAGKDVEVRFDMDREYMFIEEWGSEHLLYVVPRSGGKMRLVTDQLTWRGYIYNDHYIFWMDNPCRIHRWNRKTQKEEKTIETPLSQSNYLWELNCTEEGLYLQECGLKNKESARPGYNLYYKDFNEKKYETVWDDKKYIEEEVNEDWEVCYR